ncbi:TlyA family RNA methyltransferase [Alphaproteobacteria bacterium]|nr:TlyA family RNA methyltransferase [Alphaproteobacteria bacterium]
MKKRVDLILVEKKLAETRSKAQAMIMAGQIFSDGKQILKSGELLDTNSEIKKNNLHSEWVSRGALKIIPAFDHFKIKVTNLICIDLGASTGGFTDVLLSKKVKKVYCVDVGTNQLHERLLKNNKVINIEKTNARYLDELIIPEKVDIIVCDVSFISMKKVILPNLSLLNSCGVILALIKPQFESHKKEIKKRGVITDSKVHQRICDEFTLWFSTTCNMEVLGIMESPIKGPKGNTEFFICAVKKL